jgi:hypothetical protein
MCYLQASANGPGQRCLWINKKGATLWAKERRTPRRIEQRALLRPQHQLFTDSNHDTRGYKPGGRDMHSGLTRADLNGQARDTRTGQLAAVVHAPVTTCD